jgi:parallel beta-helix repeat protein
MDSACVEAVDCTLTGSKGPGVDISGSAHASLTRCIVTDNAGGIFMWDVATATLQSCRVNGGPHHALLADCSSRPTARECSFDGDFMLLSEESAVGVKGVGLCNIVTAPKQPAELPPEAGPFKFEADRFTRKQ